jgi:3-oxoacyl-[acyl-carrier-protein] synthase II
VNRIAITGLGIVCALGRGVREVWPFIRDGHRAFAEPRLFDGSSMNKMPVAEVSGNPDEGPGAGSRLEWMLEVAASEAVAQARLDGSSDLSRFGVAMGNSNGGMLEAESWFEHQASGESTGKIPKSGSRALKLPSSVSTDALAALFGLRGPRITNTTACSSSAGALAMAAERIRFGEVEGMVAGGGDALCRLTYAGFGSLRLLDPAGCRPFHAARRGLTLGEGAGILILESWKHALARGAEPLAELLEYGASCDAHHMTSCHPEGRGMVSAMNEAIHRSGSAAGQIDYVNAHGTATPINDAAEGKAIGEVFGGSGHSPPVSSTKSVFGHLLGGSGAVEAVTTVLALKHGVLPGTSGLDQPDEALDLNCPSMAVTESRAALAISNSFGFGGGNVVLLFSAPGNN